MFPFDQLKFQNRFELSHFELGEDTYRMDYYRTTVNEISWKSEMDRLSELDFDFKSTEIATLHEKKPYKDANGQKKECHYFPGFVFILTTVRDPYPKIVLTFFPCLMCSMLLIASF